MAETIAFIGLGNIRLPMAINLLKAGHAVRGFNVAPAANDAAGNSGITVAASPIEAVSGASIAISMLPNGKLVQELYKSGVLQAAAPETLFIDSSTIDVGSASIADEFAAASHMASLDASVSGGVGSAAAGTLTFMAGGTEAAFARGLPLLEVMGKKDRALREAPVPARLRRSATT